MKSNKLAKFMALVLLITLLAIILVSGTYAKYTTTATGSDTATVAKWSIMLDTTDITKSSTKTFTLNVFDTILDSDGKTKETNVATGKKIAPGTSGNFTLASLTNNSEVDAEYKVTYSIKNDGKIPLEFSTDTGDSKTWTSYDKLSELNSDSFTEIKQGASATTTTIYWRWAFSDNADATTRDTADTALGTATTLPEVTVTATIEVQQVD